MALVVHVHPGEALGLGVGHSFLYPLLSHRRIIHIYAARRGARDDLHAETLGVVPHLNAINVAESDPESFTRDVVNAKGEWVRNSIRAGNLKEFKSYLPAFLKPLAKEYLSILVD